MITTKCTTCHKSITRVIKHKNHFCSNICKSDWQREQKPVDKKWLIQKYLDEKLSTYQIAKIVKRNPKEVYNWLKGYNIQTRRRGENGYTNLPHNKIGWQTIPNPNAPHQQKMWLEEHYLNKRLSSAEIAKMCGVTPANIIAFLRKFKIPRRTTSEVRKHKHWGCTGKSNPMFGKFKDKNPNWKGGITKDRQAFYASQKWKTACSFVWKRDKATCQRCNCSSKEYKLHVHHIVPFANKRLRSKRNNLILLCITCHNWVHSRHNTKKVFIR